MLETLGDASRLTELAALEARSEHPLGRALLNRVGRISHVEVRDFQIHRGVGISGEVAGTRYFIGNSRLAGDCAGQSADLPEQAGRTMAYFGWDGAVKGAMAFGDSVRPGAAALCAELRRRGVRTALVSGDARGAVAPVAAAIGSDEWTAEATPEEKVAYIRGLQARGLKVAMIGDGVNDAPSLAQADLGIALGSGADIAMQAAPLVLMSNSLASIIETLDLARRTFRIVRQNLFWAFAYNTVGITLAVTGVLNPILAAGAMALSSVSVIANSRRLA